MSKIRWNSQLYLRYERERTQPSIDLASRIDLDSPAAIIDLGCGPGNSTRVPRERWRQRFSTRTFLIRIAKPADSDAVSALLVASYSSLHREGKQFPAGHPCSRTGRLYRDIKPSNIMVRLKDDGSITAKIIDLGLAKAITEPSLQTPISTPGGFVGTPEFASPEQFAGLALDTRSDLYSLGVVLWEMVTGHAVFRGSPAEVMHQHAALPLEQLDHLPQPVAVLLEVLLEKDPGRRFQTPTRFGICETV